MIKAIEWIGNLCVMFVMTGALIALAAGPVTVLVWAAVQAGWLSWPQ